MRVRLWLALLVPVAMVGCARSTGILPAGPNTYTVTEHYAPVRGGSAEAQRVALTEANAYCQSQGRAFVPNLMGDGGNPLNPYGSTDYSVTFRCLPPSDPAVAQFQLQQAPDAIVEQRNR